MRIGHNPAKKDIEAYRVKELGIISLLYIPIKEGYFAKSWDIFLYHLASVHQYTSFEFNYYLIDNGSCYEVRRDLQKLQEQGWIDFLILSDKNLGKTGALNFSLPGLRNEWICYSDSDMLFRPGWLEASKKIDKAFPNCGMISALINFPDWDIDKGNTEFRKSLDEKFVFEQIKPDEWILEEYCKARGIKNERKKFYSSMNLDRVTNIENGTQAILGGASHPQYLIKNEIIQQILPFPSKYQLNRKEDSYQDIELDRLGYLHLSTPVPYLYHMGNSIDDDIIPEIEKLILPSDISIKNLSNQVKRKKNIVWKLLNWMNNFKQGKRLLTRLYDNLHKILAN